MEKIGILGTQDRFVPTICSDGINRWNTALFALDEADFFEQKDKVVFTIAIAIYHAVSLASQRSIKESGRSLSQFYSENPSLIPAILVIRSYIVDSISSASENTNNYSHTDDPNLESFPYGKVEYFGDIKPSEIRDVIKINLIDIEKNHDKRIPCNSENKRFFKKNGQVDAYPEHIVDSFLSYETIRSFCFEFAEIIYEKILNKLHEAK